MSNKDVFYSVSDLAAKLNVPRTTVNDWLKKFDRFIDFETRGRRKVYTEESLRVLQLISEARDKGTGIVELEKKLSANCAVRPEPSPLAVDTGAVSEDTAKQENLPAVQFDFNTFLRDFEQRDNWQSKHSKRSFVLVSVLLVLLLGAACATLLLLGQLMTLKDSSKNLEMRLAASKNETELMRKNNEKEFRVIADKVERAGRSGAAAAEQLRNQLAEQRNRFNMMLEKLEKAEKLREKEIARLEQENRRLKQELAAAAELQNKTGMMLDASAKENNKLQKELQIFKKKVKELEKQQTVATRKTVKKSTAKKTEPVNNVRKSPAPEKMPENKK